jgi:arginase
MTIDVSPDGEVANMEIALLLGLTNDRLPESLARRLPALDLSTLAMLGQRDRIWIRSLGAASLTQRGVMLRTAADVATDPPRSAREAVAHITTMAPRWWLHIDLDVLSGDEFSARGEGGFDPPLPGGLRWDELTALVTAAFSAGGCAGSSLVIYNPDRDPDGSAARRVVRFVTDVTPFIPAGVSR